jgi:hypothetical protein
LVGRNCGVSARHFPNQDEKTPAHFEIAHIIFLNLSLHKKDRAREARSDRSNSRS